MTDSYAPETKNKTSGFTKFIRIAILLLLVSLVSYYFICGITYSEGTRSGVLNKISKRGYVFKTREGEMNIGGLNQGEGTIMPLSIFKFSVKQDSIYDQLEQLQGKKVVVHYKEVIKSFFWQGDTNYFVYKVNVLK
ncbi:MAG: hypothetical protein PSX36_02070 [bacterium]|nr:hypothetical protein [bacterium]